MKIVRFGLVAIATLSLGVAIAPVALAGQTSYTGPRDRTTTVNTERQKTENGTSFQRTTTYPSGQTSSATGSYTRTGKGRYERSRVYTGPRGNQTTVTGRGTYENGTLNGSRTVTYPNGQSRTGTYQRRR